jgi:hypothetical protein
MFSRYGLNALNVVLTGLIAGTFVRYSPEARASESYQFHLTKGHGVQVCEAFLQRLNVTVYDDPPYCGRPETDAVPGFKLLDRI